MQSFSISDLIDENLLMHGALDVDRRPNGISPRRLPDWCRPQLPPIMDVMVRMPSGVRLIFDTDSTSIEISALTTNIVVPPRERRPTVFDLEISGDNNTGNMEVLSQSSFAGNTILVDARDATQFELVRGDAGTWSFNNLAAVSKHCELWLPQNAYVELHGLSIDDGATISKPGDMSKPNWVHYGSSISHCMEATQPSQIWPAVAARKAGACLLNLGLAGQCHLDQFVARTIRDCHADLISIKTGINIVNMDSMRERVYKPALHGFLDTIRDGQPNTPITLISPMYCPSAENHPGPTVADEQGRFQTIPGHEEIREGCLSLTRIRRLIREVIEVRNDDNLHYVNGLDLFGENDEGDLPDDLHPNPVGYQRMGRRFADLHLTSMVRELTRS